MAEDRVTRLERKVEDLEKELDDVRARCTLKAEGTIPKVGVAEQSGGDIEYTKFTTKLSDEGREASEPTTEAEPAESQEQATPSDTEE